VQVAAHNLALLMRKLFGVGKPRSLQGSGGPSGLPGCSIGCLAAGLAPAVADAPAPRRHNGLTPAGRRRSENALFQRAASVRRKSCASESQASVCVQERLLCPAGVSPVGVTIGSPVAGWQAGGKPKDLKPIDNPIRGMGASRRAVTTVNAWWPRK